MVANMWSEEAKLAMCAARRPAALATGRKEKRNETAAVYCKSATELSTRSPVTAARSHLVAVEFDPLGSALMGAYISFSPLSALYPHRFGGHLHDWSPFHRLCTVGCSADRL